MVRRFESTPVDLLWLHLSAKRPTYFARGIDVSNPAPSANESVSAGSRGRCRPRRGCGAGPVLLRDARKCDQTLLAPFFLTGIDAVPLPQSSDRSQRRAGRGGGAACGISPGCAAQLASSLCCSVHSRGRLSSVRRVAVNSTGCRLCKIASTSSGLRKARPTFSASKSPSRLLKAVKAR